MNYKTVKEFMEAGKAAGHDSFGLANDAEAEEIFKQLSLNSMKPSYVSGFAAHITIDQMLNEVNWGTFTDAREECFMAPEVMTYTYGAGRGVRTYTSGPYYRPVLDIQDALNTGNGHLAIDDAAKLAAATGVDCWSYNVCFLNRYNNSGQHLGWHSDDSPGMDHEHPIAVVSFGQAREIWWRHRDQKGVIPADQRQLLEHGSLFVMPAGFQREHQHRIPKGDKEMGPRVSLTFRHYIKPD